MAVDLEFLDRGEVTLLRLKSQAAIDWAAKNFPDNPMEQHADMLIERSQVARISRLASTDGLSVGVAG